MCVDTVPPVVTAKSEEPAPKGHGSSKMTGVFPRSSLHLDTGPQALHRTAKICTELLGPKSLDAKQGQTYFDLVRIKYWGGVMSHRRRGVGFLAAAVLAGGGVLAIAPAYAYSVDCVHGLYTATSGVYAGRSKPMISCGTVVDAQARARADCTLAPDTYTAWVRSWQSSSGGYCLFGARGSILEMRPG